MNLSIVRARLSAAATTLDGIALLAIIVASAAILLGDPPVSWIVQAVCLVAAGSLLAAAMARP